MERRRPQNLGMEKKLQCTESRSSEQGPSKKVRLESSFYIRRRNLSLHEKQVYKLLLLSPAYKKEAASQQLSQELISFFKRSVLITNPKLAVCSIMWLPLLGNRHQACSYYGGWHCHLMKKHSLVTLLDSTTTEKLTALSPLDTKSSTLQKLADWQGQSLLLFWQQNNLFWWGKSFLFVAH